MKLVVGIIGEIGGGKGTVIDLLRRYLAAPTTRTYHLSTSRFLAETLTKWSLQVTRTNLQNLAIQMDAGFGTGTLTRAIEATIQEREEPVVIYDSIRWPSDLKLVHQFPHLVLYVTANVRVRWRRVRERREKIDECSVTLDQFRREGKRRTETQIPRLAKKADVVIRNNGGLSELRRAVRTLVNKEIRPRLNGHKR